MTIGVIADRNVPGTTMPRPATTISRIVPPSIEPAARTAGGVAATATPEMASSGPMSRRGGTASASRPPDQEPAAMAARAEPMTMVLVSRVSPRYGASSRRATSSTTSTAAEAPKTSAAAA